MQRAILSWFQKRKVLIVVVLFLIATLTFFMMGTVSKDQLMSQQWCSSLPYPFLRWDFHHDGKFEQQSIIIDSVGAASGYTDSGEWRVSGNSVEIALQKRNMITQARFKIRATRFAGFLWTYAELMGDYNGKGLYFWHPCPDVS